eukprot:3908052-Prymnesium_polylepis.1
MRFPYTSDFYGYMPLHPGRETARNRKSRMCTVRKSHLRFAFGHFAVGVGVWGRVWAATRTLPSTPNTHAVIQYVQDTTRCHATNIPTFFVHASEHISLTILPAQHATRDHGIAAILLRGPGSFTARGDNASPANCPFDPTLSPLWSAPSIPAIDATMFGANMCVG